MRLLVTGYRNGKVSDEAIVDTDDSRRQFVTRIVAVADERDREFFEEFVGNSAVSFTAGSWSVSETDSDTLPVGGPR